MMVSENSFLERKATFCVIKFWLYYKIAFQNDPIPMRFEDINRLFLQQVTFPSFQDYGLSDAQAPALLFCPLLLLWALLTFLEVLIKILTLPHIDLSFLMMLKFSELIF